MKFTDSQLNDIRRLFNQIATETYGLEREALKATAFIPRQSGVGEWAGSWTYKVLSEMGIAKFISDYAEELPPVSRAMELRTVTIRQIADSYGYSEAEVMQWLTAGIDLSRDDAETARRKIDEKVDEVLLVGDKSVGIEGLFNNSNVTKVTIEAGAKGTTDFKSKTLDEIVASVQAMIDGAYALNGGSVVLDTIILPHGAFSHIATASVSATGSTTILNHLKTVFLEQGITDWQESRKLDGIGDSSKDRAVLYKKAANVVSYVLPIPFRQKAPQECALHFKVPCYARIGGTVIKNPKAIVYADGV